MLLLTRIRAFSSSIDKYMLKVNNKVTSAFNWYLQIFWGIISRFHF